jgi:hypothetical protein
MQIWTRVEELVSSDQEGLLGVLHQRVSCPSRILDRGGGRLDLTSLPLSLVSLYFLRAHAVDGTDTIGTGTGLLGTFPNVGLDTTLLLGCTTNNDESFMSLNTTVSNPSQFPPTADQSSVLNLPRWSIPLTKLTPLSTLLSSSTSSKSRTESSQATLSISTIVCVLSVDQPVLRKRKEEKARGRDGTLWIGNWNVTAPPDGDTGGEVGGCAVKLWDNAAKEWGDERVRKGDVVLLESRSQSFPLHHSSTVPAVLV